jgi:hypothetical protein
MSIPPVAYTWVGDCRSNFIGNVRVGRNKRNPLILDGGALILFEQIHNVVMKWKCAVLPTIQKCRMTLAIIAVTLATIGVR